MSEIIRPITQFTSPKDLGELAARVLSMVSNANVREILKKRHLTGVLERYPRVSNPSKEDITVAVRRVQRAREQHQKGIVGTYAVFGVTGDIIGLATLIPGLRLKRHRTLVPKLFSPEFLQERIPIAGPEVTAWTSELCPEIVEKVVHSQLGEAYTALVAPEGPLGEFSGANNAQSNPWTIEPQHAPSWIHGAITQSGMRRRGMERRYDDGEPEKLWYPYSVLYSMQPVPQSAA